MLEIVVCFFFSDFVRFCAKNSCNAQHLLSYSINYNFPIFLHISLSHANVFIISFRFSNNHQQSLLRSHERVEESFHCQSVGCQHQSLMCVSSVANWWFPKLFLDSTVHRMVMLAYILILGLVLLFVYRKKRDEFLRREYPERYNHY